MGKVTKSAVTRGVKITPEHWGEPLAAIEVDITDATKLVDATQLDKAYAYARLNLNIDRLTSKFTQSNSRAPWYFPFIIADFQESYDASLLIADPTSITLVEVGLSFNQRGEAGVLADTYCNNNAGGANALDGTLIYSAPERYGVNLTLWSKRQAVRVAILESQLNVDTAREPDRMLWNASIAPEAFASKTSRLNPASWGDIAIPMDPNDTYLFGIFADLDGGEGAGGAAPHRSAMLSSVQISLKLRCELVERDSGSSIQNIPSNTDGEKTVLSSMNLDVPIAGDTIIGDSTSEGISSNLELLDDIVQAKYRGGYLKHGRTLPVEHVLTDACYDIITVPMFQGAYNTAINASNDIVLQPYAQALPTAGPLGDRRIIPITHPFLIHHVIWAINFMPSGPHTDNLPTSVTCIMECGVGMLVGPAGEWAQYQQIAGPLTLNGPVDFSAAWAADRIDLVRFPLDYQAGETSHEWDLHMVPLDGTGGKPLVPGRTQGMPIYVGDTGSEGVLRRDMSATGAPATTLGQEQFLEVRCVIRDAGGLGFDGGGGAPASVEETYAGPGGHIVYIIGKKVALAEWGK